jgi:antitoxin VapB
MSVRAKLFSSGRSQAVRLPKALRFEGEEVIAKPFGNGVLLLPINAPWQLMREALDEFEPGFELQREQPGQQARDWTSGSGSDPA